MNHANDKARLLCLTVVMASAFLGLTGCSQELGPVWPAPRGYDLSIDPNKSVIVAKLDVEISVVGIPAGQNLALANLDSGKTGSVPFDRGKLLVFVAEPGHYNIGEIWLFYGALGLTGYGYPGPALNFGFHAEPGQVIYVGTIHYKPKSIQPLDLAAAVDAVVVSDDFEAVQKELAKSYSQLATKLDKQICSK